MRKKGWFLLVLTLVFLSRFLISLKTSLWAATDASEPVDATVKISVCGNYIKEGGEDCDNDDLNNQTCVSIGYGPGNLDCQADCSFDVSGCGPAPTATPTPMATPTPTPTTAVTATSAPGPTSTPAPVPTATPTPIVVTLIEILPLPVRVATFDIDGDGQIAVQEIAEAVQLWVEEWRKELKKVKVEITFPEEKETKKEAEKEKPKSLVERILFFGRKEEPTEAEERGILETVRDWVIGRLGGETPEPLPGPPAAEVLKRKLERALEVEEEKAALVEERKCDVNKDRGCDLIDFSVLLYYINR